MSHQEGETRDDSTQQNYSDEGEQQGTINIYEQLYSELKNSNDERGKIHSPLPSNLETPSESIRKSINQFSTNNSSLENVENYDVDFDYLKALSELPNVEPIKRLTKSFSTPSSSSNSKYLFHWMNYKQEDNFIGEITPNMDANLLKHFSIKPSLKFDKTQQLTKLFNISKNLLKKKENLTQHSVQEQEQPRAEQTIEKRVREEVSSDDDDSDSEEEENLFMIDDDNFEVGGLDDRPIPEPSIVPMETKRVVEVPNIPSSTITDTNIQFSEPTRKNIAEEKELLMVDHVTTIPHATATNTTTLLETPTIPLLEQMPPVPSNETILSKPKQMPPPVPLLYNLKTKQTIPNIQPELEEKTHDGEKKKRKRKKKDNNAPVSEKEAEIIDSFTPHSELEKQKNEPKKKERKKKKEKKPSLEPEKNPLFHLGKPSSLDEKDQDIYNKGLKQFKLFQNQNAISRQVAPPSAYFFQLKRIVEEEQNAFRKALFDDAWNNRQTRYFYIDPFIAEQVEAMKLKKKSDRILPTNTTSSLESMAVLPRHYELLKSLNIPHLQQTKQVISNTTADPILRFSKLIYQTSDKYFKFNRGQLIYQVSQDEDTAEDNDEGETKPVKLPKYPISTNIYQVNDPTLNPNNTITEETNTDSNNVYNPLEDSSRKKDNAPVNLYHHRILPELSEDPIIMQTILPQMADIDFVCSSSAMATLVNTLAPTFSEEWCLPVIAKPKTDDKFTIFIEKPMIKKTWTLRENNQLYYKYAIKTLSLKEPMIHIPCRPAIPKAEYNDCDDYSQYELLHRDGEPISYNLFTLANYKLLIRAKLDGANLDVKTDRPTAIKLLTKLEYQTEKGLELSTQSELADWWINVFMRPASAAVLARVDVAQNRVCRTEFKRIKEILPSIEDEEEENERYWSNMLTSNLSSLGLTGGSNCGFQPQLSVQTIYGLFNELKLLISQFQSLNLNDYRFLIQKMANEPYVHLLVEHRKTTPETIPRSLPQKFYYDLHMDYEKHGGINDTQTMPYIPLVWKISNQIPYTFPIRPSPNWNKSDKSKNKKKKQKKQ